MARIIHLQTYVELERPMIIPHAFPKIFFLKSKHPLPHDNHSRVKWSAFCTFIRQVDVSIIDAARQVIWPMLGLHGNIFIPEELP